MGREGTPRFYQFESPLLRLMEHDHKPQVRVSQAQLLAGSEPHPVWLHRLHPGISMGIAAWT